MKLTELAKRSAAAWSGAGLSHRAIAERLLTEQGIKVSHVAVGKELAKAKANGGPAPRAPKARSPVSAPASSPSRPASSSSSAPSSPALEPQDDNAEATRLLRKLRRQAARQAFRKNATALDQQRAATTLLLAIAELRKANPPAPPSTDTSSADDALEVRRRLEKLREQAKAPTS